MISPSVMVIEMAAESLRCGDTPTWLVASEIHEIESFGIYRAKKLGATGITEDFKIGYELGLETARVILRNSPILAIAKINPAEIL